MREAGYSEDEIKHGAITKTAMPGGLAQAGESFKEGAQSVAKGMLGFAAMVGENKKDEYITGNMWRRIGEASREHLAMIDQRDSAPLNAEGFVNDFVRNLPQIIAEIVKAMPEENFPLVKGAVPGANGGILVVRSALKKPAAK